MKHRIITLALSVCLALSPHLYAQVLTLQEAMATRGTALLIRHAIAPGFGDPENFQVNNCRTQRNLSSQGQAQSRAIGAALINAGFQPAEILSSPWCRCLDTAKFMEIGPVRAFDGLASFFQGHADRTETMRLLRSRLAEIDPKDQPLVMVTHQVVISALTGIGTRSGGAVLYDPSTNRTQQVEMPKPPYE